MTSIRIEQNLFSEFIKALLPKLAAHFEAVGLPLSIVTTNWFMCLFVNTLPVDTLLRVWDILIVHGPMCLIRVGTAILKVQQDDPNPNPNHIPNPIPNPIPIPIPNPDPIPIRPQGAAG